MLNTYAAVLQAAFPARQMGVFRSTLSTNSVRFATSTSQNFTALVFPGVARSDNIQMPSNVVQATVGVSWGLSTNDFGLKLYNSGGALIGESNYLNLPGLTGRREEIVLRNPSSQAYRSVVQHTGGIGTSQNVYEAVEVTQAVYPTMLDLNSLSPDMVAEAEKSLLTNVMLPEGRKFRPDSPVSRFDLAATFVRAGLVSQYMAASPLFTDVKDFSTRNAVESVQANPNGKLFYDAAAGDRFYPNISASKLVAAIAFVKAANLDNLAASSSLSPSVTDSLTIPAQWRGYVAVALQNGFIRLDGNQFNPNRALTRLELAQAANSLIR